MSQQQSTLKSALKWIVRPGFSRQNSNPFQGVGQPTDSLIPKQSPGSKFGSMEDVLHDNPEFEQVRIRALSKLKLRLWVLIGVAIAWVYMQSGESSSFFAFGFMRDVIAVMYSAIITGMLWVTDFQYIAFRDRIVGLTMRQYIRGRFHV